MISDCAFLWVVSASQDTLTLIIQPDNNKNTKITVLIASNINCYWSCFPNVNELNIKVIKPSEVRKIIEYAIMDGWDPKTDEKKYTYKYYDNKLEKC